MYTSPAFQQAREQQKEMWNRSSLGRKKWDAFNTAFLRPVGDEITADLRLSEYARVLDIATGTGEPGLSIAAARPKCIVIGMDIAGGMLDVAGERARAAGLHNYHTIVADVSALPFADATFDAVSCGMGFMFFPDMVLAAREVMRVLRPGGRFSTSVWGSAPLNPWVTTMLDALQRHGALPLAPVAAPGLFRCAGPGLLSGLMRAAGLRNVTEKEILGQVHFDSPDQYWAMMTEAVPPVVALVKQLDEFTRARIKADVFAALGGGAGRTSLYYGARVVSGEK